jgi:hypothetical protein
MAIGKLLYVYLATMLVQILKVDFVSSAILSFGANHLLKEHELSLEQTIYWKNTYIV